MAHEPFTYELSAAKTLRTENSGSFFLPFFDGVGALAIGVLAMSSKHWTQRELAAFHEAGHAYMALRQRSRVHRVSIRPGADYLGIVHHRNRLHRYNPDVEDTPHAQCAAEGEIRIALAGIESVRRICPRRANRGAGSDRQHVTEILLALTPIEAEQQAYFRLLELQTRSIIADPTAWAGIEAVAKALLFGERETLSGRAVRDIINEATMAFAMRRQQAA